MENNDKSVIRNLIDKLNYYTKLYDEGHPAISDKEWDDMYFELVKLEKETQEYYEDSPTQRVNYQVVNELKKVEHSHPMLSLDKTKSIDEVKAFIGNKEWIAMAKMDGLTCSLTYENGRLVKAETRGNGFIGEDILHNALQIKNIPNKINYKNKLVIDGEVICTYNNFKNFEKEYKNPRNFASGSIRLLDSKESAMRNLSFIAWDIIEGFEEKKLNEKLWRLHECYSFDIVPYYNKKDNNETIEDAIETIQSYCRDMKKYPIDGIVFKYNNIDEYLAAGCTDHHFKGGIAYKFYDNGYETELLDIAYDIGRTGQLTPVAIYKEIEIDGSICNRASLHNQSILKETLHGMGWKGQKILVAKMNMIIPQIIEAEEDNEYTKEYIDYPHICPICGGETSIHKDNNSEVLYCDNPNCEGKLINRIDHFCSKKGLDIKGLSKATLEKLLDWGYIGDIQSVFELKEFREGWIKKPGFGVASVDKILNAIDTARKTSLEKVIAAAGIPEIGTRVAKDLAKHYSSWSDFRSEINFLKYDGIGEIMNANLLNFDYTEIDYIVEHYLYIPTEENHNELEDNLGLLSNKKLKDKVFCITGKVHTFKNRTELQTDIESKGGKVVSSISSKVNYLINNDSTSTSSKNLKAKELNIKIITENEYLEMN